MNIDNLKLSNQVNTHESLFKSALDIVVAYLNSIDISINYDCKEISVYTDSEFVFDSLAFLPYYFTEIKEKDCFKLFIKGAHPFDVVFRGEHVQTDDAVAVYLGWVVDIISTEVIERTLVDLIIK